MPRTELFSFLLVVYSVHQPTYVLPHLSLSLFAEIKSSRYFIRFWLSDVQQRREASSGVHAGHSVASGHLLPTNFPFAYLL